ncbi:HAD-IA family hydrolase, partial [Candidatus Bipolaricaulota bacterium]|nr:HAD-IA family hydrolase [Candidatus Bipolaricaulota bacterium]
MAQQCVLFDMDGTIYDSEISIQAIRDQLELPQDGRPILDQLGEQSPEVRDLGIELLHVAEAEGAANGKLIPGTRELLSWLREKNLRCGLVTNNSRRSVNAILVRHPLSFDVVVTREDATMKPAPDLFLLALDKLGCNASDAVAVGDTHLDAIAAHRAGIR